MTRLALGAKCGALVASDAAPGTDRPAAIAFALSARDWRDSRSSIARLPKPREARRSMSRREKLFWRAVIALSYTPGLRYSEDPDLSRGLRNRIRVFGVP